MSDLDGEGILRTPAGAGYTEEIVEWVDNSRRRTLLILLFLLLILMLLGVSYWVFALTRPPGQPSKSSLPEGVQWVRSIYGWGAGRDKSLQAPTDVAIGNNGTIWTLSDHRSIVGFRPDGSAKQIITPDVGLSLEGIDVGDDGDLYVTDYGGAVYRFTTKGVLKTTWRVELPNEVSVRDGKIAVAAANGIAVFTPDDKILAQLGSRGRGNDQFDLPHGIQLGKDGTVFVSDTHNRRVRAFSPQGRLLWTAGPGPAAKAADWRSKEASNSLFELPSGMTLDAAGRLVLVDPFKFQVIALDPKTGSVARVKGAKGATKPAVYGDFGQNDGAFYYPTGIAYDKTRDWFAVADTGNNRIQIIRLPGSGGSRITSVVGGFRLPVLVFLLPLLMLVGAAVAAIARQRRLAQAAGSRSAAA